jgi:hypothetical protein
MDDLFLNRMLSEWLRDRFERTIGDLNLWMKPSVKAETFINKPGQVLSLRAVIHEFFQPKI